MAGDVADEAAPRAAFGQPRRRTGRRDSAAVLYGNGTVRYQCYSIRFVLVPSYARHEDYRIYMLVMRRLHPTSSPRLPFFIVRLFGALDASRPYRLMKFRCFQ